MASRLFEQAYPDHVHRGTFHPSHKNRAGSIDALRGLIIVFMALDHANYFIAHQHSSGEYWGGPFPAYRDALSFLTRFVTHFSAPGFFLLMGVGMSFFAAKRREQGWSPWAIRLHFLIHGLLLGFIQLSIVNQAWRWGPAPFPNIYIGVLIALGGTMILGGLLVGLPDLWLTLISLALFIGTKMLQPAPEMWGLLTNDLPNLLLVRPGGTGILWSNYPILPWLELVAFGLLLGSWLKLDSQRAFKRMKVLGVVFLLAFAILRLLDGFGNIRPRPGDNWIDFLNLVKYPPSMTFTLLTTGINLLLLSGLAWLDRQGTGWLNFLKAYGRAPLFVYVAHLFLYMFLGRIFTPEGTSLPVMYAFWLIGLAILYAPAVWYGRWKSRQPAASPARFL